MEGYQPTKKEEDNAESFMTKTQAEMSRVRDNFFTEAKKLDIDPVAFNLDDIYVFFGNNRNFEFSGVLKGHQIDLKLKQNPGNTGVGEYTGKLDGVNLTPEEAKALSERIYGFVSNGQSMKGLERSHESGDERIQNEIKQKIKEETNPKARDVLKDVFGVEVTS